MRIEELHLNMQVRHPQYGLGVVKQISEHTAEILFNEGMRTIAPEQSGIQPSEPETSIIGLNVPLKRFISEVVHEMINSMGLEKPDTAVDQLATRWHKGKLVLHPGDPSLQTKEVPLETFFHKIVMMRNNMRVLEQKINSHSTLSDSEKVELQQYVTRCYGSMTTFNLLFKQKEDQFGGGV
jgi:hypothetical protein